MALAIQGWIRPRPRARPRRKPDQTPLFTQKDIDKVKPKPNELASAFEGTNRKAELEKLLGTAPPKTQAVQKPVEGEKPPASLDTEVGRHARDDLDEVVGRTGQADASRVAQEPDGAAPGDGRHHTTASTTRYDATRSPPVPRSRTDSDWVKTHKDCQATTSNLTGGL